MTEHPQCSIIVRTYNEEQHIGRLLTGIMEQSVDDVEIIVVDSGSTDATVSIASRFPTTILHIKPEQFTFGRSLNLGCSVASGDYLVFASAHVYPVYENWLAALLAPFEDPGIALVYGRQMGSSSTHYSEHRQFERMYPQESRIPQDFPLCNNANAGIRRHLWEQHSYDESLPGLEDLEWGTWALAQGHLLAYEADAVIVHVHEETPAQVYNRYKREAIALTRIRPEDKFGLAGFIRLFLSNILHDARQSISDGLFLQSIASILWYRWMQYWGSYVGFRHSGPVTSQVIRAFYYPESSRKRDGPDGSDRQMIDYSQSAWDVENESSDD